jgi:flagellar M-ring protein FliF
LSEKADERRLRLESQLARTIEQLLEKTVGPGKIRAEVFADMDFDRINTSEEVYDPDGQVVRSTQSVSEGSKSTENGGEPPVSVAGNLPDSESGVNGQGSNSASDNRSEETVNYEISKKVTNHVREAGIINRLSVAVLVDGRYTPDANGALVYQPRPPEELERLNSLVRGVIGFNQKRGDTVEIVNLQFAEPDPEPDEGFPFPFGLEKNDLFRIAEYMVLSLLSLLVLLLVIRPMVARLLEALPRTPVASLAPSLMGAGNGQVALAAPGAAAPGSSGGAPQLPSSASGAVPTGVPTVGSAALPPSGGLTPEEMIIVDRVEGRVKASSVRKIGEFIEKHPDESLAIIRHWLHTEE